MSWKPQTGRAAADGTAGGDWAPDTTLRRVAPFAPSTLDRARAADRRRETPAPAVAAPAPLERLLVGTGERLVVVRLEEVDWIAGDGNYLELHVGATSHRHRASLTALASRLDPRRFARIHRSTVVNVERVAELQATGSGGGEVVLRDGTRLALSRSHKRRFLALLGGDLHTAP